MSKIKFTGRFKNTREYLKSLADKYEQDLIHDEECVVYGEDCGSALLKAQASGVTIFNESEFLSLVVFARFMRGETL